MLTLSTECLEALYHSLYFDYVKRAYKVRIIIAIDSCVQYFARSVFRFIRSYNLLYMVDISWI